MIHEVMVLDHSGPAFGLILYGAALKLFAFGALVVHLAVPIATGHVWLDRPIFLGGTVLVAVAVGVIESTMARLKMTHVPILLVAACLLSAFGIILVPR
jgi:formate hydrogenlyase subunit 4